MAKVKIITIPEGLERYYNKSVQVSDRFAYSAVRMTNPIVSRKKRVGLTQKSQLPLCSSIWNTYNETLKTLWNNCGAISGLTGFRFFVQDKVLRLKNYLEGESTPSLLYQSNVGHLHVESPASSLKITQLHPLDYYVLRKIKGKATMYEAVPIVEDFQLPLDLRISYKSNLTVVGADPVASFYAIVYSLYQGRTIETYCSIDFDLSTDWKSASFGVGEVLGLLRGYSLFFELKDVRGDVWFDNIESVHSQQNWARDPKCNNIRQGFTKKWYQVPAHWVAIDLPSGSIFLSEYGNI